MIIVLLEVLIIFMAIIIVKITLIILIKKKVWTISNALWFGIGSFLGQGCDILPKYCQHLIIFIFLFHNSPSFS